MALFLTQIKDILRENPNAAIVATAKNMRRRLRCHMFGDGMASYIQRINSFENDDQYAAREIYGRSNQDLFERIGRPVDKVFSAKGGSTYYNLPETQDKQFRMRLHNVENGLPLRKWNEQYWKPAYLSDPMGLTFCEIDANGDAYPTYKGANEIYSYQLNGRYQDWVIFTTADPQVFRVVDEVSDRHVKWDGKNVEQIDVIPNHFGVCPGIINSDLPILGTDNFESPFQRIIEIADEFLRECSVKSVYKLLHAFPKYWEYVDQCPACDGTRFVEGEKCPVCNGTGTKMKWDVSDKKTLPIPEDDTKIIAPDIAGYITPPIDAWTKMSEELRELETLMFQTLWGTKQTEEYRNNTATGRFIDQQPVNDRLSKFSDAAELVEQFETDLIGRIYYPKTYGGSSVKYGRRFLLESHDTIWEKYQKARMDGAPEAVLDDLLSEYYQSKYENNSIELQKQLQLLNLEPFVHLKPGEVKQLDPAPRDYAKKLYFSDFVKTLTDNEVIFGTLDALNAKFDAYIDTKMEARSSIES